MKKYILIVSILIIIFLIFFALKISNYVHSENENDSITETADAVAKNENSSTTEATDVIAENGNDSITKAIDVITDDYIFYGTGDGIYLYSDNSITKFRSGFMPYSIRENGKFVYWVILENEHSDEYLPSSHIICYNKTDKEFKEFTVDGKIFYVWIENDYAVFSRLRYSRNKNDRGGYEIVAMNMNDESQSVVSDTQNIQVEFSCYNNKIYYLEEGNQIWEYDIEKKSKLIFLDEMERRTSERVDLAANSNGVFFTMPCDYEGHINLYKYNGDTQGAVLVKENVKDVIQYNDDVMFYKAKDGTYRYDLKTGLSAQITPRSDCFKYIINDNYIAVYCYDEVIYLYDYINCEPVNGFNEKFWNEKISGTNS